MSDRQPLTGHCYCGALHYRATNKPVFNAQCHCRECQYISGGGPNYFMILAVADFEWTKGTPQTFARSDLETPRTRCFCATCGTHMTTELPDGERLVLKVGTLDDPSQYAGPSAAIFTIDQQPFHVITEGIATHHRLP